MAEAWALGLVVLATVVGALGPVMLKKASGKLSFSVRKTMRNHHLILGIMFYGLATVLFVPALKGGQLSVLYPVTSLTYVWVAFLSTKMLGERMNWKKWVGISLIVLGVSTIGFVA